MVAHAILSQKGLCLLSSSGPGPGQVPGQVQKVQGLRTKDLDLGILIFRMIFRNIFRMTLRMTLRMTFRMTLRTTLMTIWS